MPISGATPQSIVAASVYNAGSYPSRPSGYATVLFIGPVDPGSTAQDGDLWLNTA